MWYFNVLLEGFILYRISQQNFVFFASMDENCQQIWDFLKVLNWFLQYQRYPSWILLLHFHWLVIVKTKNHRLLNEFHMTLRRTKLFFYFQKCSHLLHDLHTHWYYSNYMSLSNEVKHGKPLIKKYKNSYKPKVQLWWLSIFRNLGRTCPIIILSKSCIKGNAEKNGLFHEKRCNSRVIFILTISSF